MIHVLIEYTSLEADKALWHELQRRISYDDVGGIAFRVLDNHNELSEKQRQYFYCGGIMQEIANAFANHWQISDGDAFIVQSIRSPYIDVIQELALDKGYAVKMYSQLHDYMDYRFRRLEARRYDAWDGTPITMEHFVEEVTK